MAGIVLAGVDNSPTALEAAKKAATLAAALEFELHIVSAFRPDEASLPHLRHASSRTEIAAAVEEKQETFRRYEDVAEKTAMTVADTLRMTFPELTMVLKAVEGNPAAALVKEANDVEADVVVVGNKRVQSAGRFLGSIAQEVALDINGDLYVVHTHKR